MKKAKNLYSYKRLTNEQLRQVSDLYGIPLLELFAETFDGNLWSSVWKSLGHQHGGRKSMKTSGIHFCS